MSSPATRPTAMEADHGVGEVVARARAAHRQFANASRTDDAVRALAWSLSSRAARAVAEMAVADTGLGNCPTKSSRTRKTFGTLRDLLRVKTVGIIEEDAARGASPSMPSRWGCLLRAHALDLPPRHAGEQGDDGHQGPQRHHHCALAAGLQDDRTAAGSCTRSAGAPIRSNSSTHEVDHSFGRLVAQRRGRNDDGVAALDGHHRLVHRRGARVGRGRHRSDDPHRLGRPTMPRAASSSMMPTEFTRSRSRNVPHVLRRS